jgi:hypothetical protein
MKLQNEPYKRPEMLRVGDALLEVSLSPHKRQRHREAHPHLTDLQSTRLPELQSYECKESYYL